MVFTGMANCLRLFKSWCIGHVLHSIPLIDPRNTAKYKLNAAKTSLQIPSSCYQRWNVKRSSRHVSCLAKSKWLTHERNIFIWTEHFQCFCEIWDMGMRYREFCESIPRQECRTEKVDLWENFGWHVKSRSTRRLRTRCIVPEDSRATTLSSTVGSRKLVLWCWCVFRNRYQRHFLTVN